MMLKRFIVCAAIFVAGNAAAVQLTDAGAKKLAIGMETQLAEARTELNKMIKAGNPSAYEEQVRAPLQSKVRAWPDKSLDGRAIFPYFSCKEAAISLLQYGDAWARPANKSFDQAWRDRKIEQFRESHVACAEAIKKPDMSLKNIH